MPYLYGIIGCMKKTLHIEENLLRDAKAASGAVTDTDTVRLGLQALVRRAAYRTASGASRIRTESPRRPPPPGARISKGLELVVLVDTSVWIRFLSNQAPYSAELDRLLGDEDVSAHDLVFGELLIGDKGGRTNLLAHYEQMHQAPVVSPGEVTTFVRERRLYGRGIGWIDAHLLASALVGRLWLWTVDPRVKEVAKELGVAHHSV